MPEAHVVKLGGVHRRTDFNIARNPAVGQLHKGLRPELFGSGKRSSVAVTTMLIDQLDERGLREKFHHLREQHLSGVHKRLGVGLYSIGSDSHDKFIR